jgi:hypothetical protein
MSVTVLESIALELERRLNLLVNQSTYNTNVCEVLRPRRLDDFTSKDLQIVLTKGDEEIVDELSCPGNPPSIAKRVTFNIRCTVATDEHDLTSVDTIVDMFVADVEKVVAGLDNNWFNFDSNAINAQFLAPIPYSADGGIDGMTLPIAITYRHSEGDPYEVRA